MRNQTRHPKVTQDDLNVAGLASAPEHIPAWELDLVAPYIERLLLATLDSTPNREVFHARQG